MLLSSADAGNGSSGCTLCKSNSRPSGVIDQKFIRSRQRVSTTVRSLQRTYCFFLFMTTLHRAFDHRQLFCLAVVVASEMKWHGLVFDQWTNRASSLVIG